MSLLDRLRNTLLIPIRAKTISHKCLTKEQCNKIWWIISSSWPQRKHRQGAITPYIARYPTVEVCPFIENPPPSAPLQMTLSALFFMKDTQQVYYPVYFPIIAIPCKLQIPRPITHCLILHLCYFILVTTNSYRAVKENLRRAVREFEGWVTAPRIHPEANSSTISNFENPILFDPKCFFQDIIPKVHPKRSLASLHLQPKTSIPYLARIRHLFRICFILHTRFPNLPYNCIGCTGSPVT